MEIGRTGDGKHTKYNHGAPIDLDIISQTEREQALIEFSEGSKGLEACLRTMWSNGLKTHACCSGNDEEYDTAYISMASDIDVFSFLSEDILLTDMVALTQEEDQQIIYIGGSSELKEQLLHRVALDIASGKKENTLLLEEKIGKPLNEGWRKEGRMAAMRKRGLSEEEIEQEEHQLEVFRMFYNGSEEEQDKIKPEFMKELEKLNRRLVERETQANNKK